MFLMNDQRKTGRVARVPHLSRLLWHDLVQGDGDDGRPFGVGLLHPVHAPDLP